MNFANIRATTSGEIVEIITINRGWFKITKLGGGELPAVRASALRELNEDERLKLMTVHNTPTLQEFNDSAPLPLSTLDLLGDILEESTGAKIIIQLKPDLAHYVTHTVKTACGRKSLDIADEAADILRGQDITDCYFIVAKHIVRQGERTFGPNGDEETRLINETEAELKTKYSHLNPGMVRMNLGNRLRKAMGIYSAISVRKELNAKQLNLLVTE